MERQVMTLTESAARRLKEIMGDSKTGVRVGVKNGGCAGMEYTMGYVKKPDPHDTVVEDKGVKILIEPAALMFLIGTQMDYTQDKLSSGFVFNNPNAVDSCGCGISVSLRPAQE